MLPYFLRMSLSLPTIPAFLCSLASVLVGWDCCSRAKQQECIVSQFWSLEACVTMSSELVPSGACERESLPGLSLSFWWLAGNFSYSFGFRNIPATPFLPSSSHGVLPVYVTVTSFPFLREDNSHILLEPPLMVHLKCTTFLKSLSPNKSHSQAWGLRLVWGQAV